MKIIVNILGLILSFSSIFVSMPSDYQNNNQSVSNENYEAYEYEDIYEYEDVYEYEDINETYDADSLTDSDTVTGSSSNAPVSGLFQTQYYQTYYFNQLDQNIGSNTKGSCGFVATGMLLSYWDTYWMME